MHKQQKKCVYGTEPAQCQRHGLLQYDHVSLMDIITTVKLGVCVTGVRDRECRVKYVLSRHAFPKITVSASLITSCLNVH